MMTILAEVKKREEHVLNFKGLVTGRITLPYDRIKGSVKSSNLFRRIEKEVMKFDDYFRSYSIATVE